MTDDASKQNSRRRQRDEQHVQRTPAEPSLLLAMAVLLALVVIGLGFWAFDQRSSLQDVQGEITRLERELSRLRDNADSTSYRLMATPDGPPSASGTAFLSLSGSGVLAVSNLPAPRSGQGYQIWYFPTGGKRATPGGFLTLDANGQGFALLPADAAPAATIGISLEPTEGSSRPTGPLLITGSLGGARG